MSILRPISTLSLLILAITTCASATQIVTLDFDTFTTPATEPDDYVYAAGERMAIKEMLEDLYMSDPADPFGGPFGIKFDILDPAFPPVPFTTTIVKFNSSSFGSAEKIDFRNLDDDDDVSLNALGTLKLYDGTARSPELGGGTWTLPELTSSPAVVQASANIAAHELGHSFGLRHHDSFTPIETGIGVDPTKYSPTYPGPFGITLASSHIMGLNSAVALNANTLLSPSYFSERSALKLALMAAEDELGPNPYVVDESTFGGDASDFGGAPSLFGLDPIGMPNTLRAPHPDAPIFAGPEFFSPVVQVIKGTIEPRDLSVESTDVDYYTFSGVAGQRLTIEVISHVMRDSEGGRITDWVDPVVELLDGTTFLPLPYGAGGVTISDNQFESKDSILFDAILPSTGDYLIDLRSAMPGEGSAPAETGEYELFVYAFDPLPPAILYGDYNANGFVDDADYVVWLASLGSSVVLPNDLTPGSVTESDYDVWVGNYGELLPGGPGSLLGPISAAGVPEPTSAALVLVSACALFLVHRQRLSGRQV